MKNWIVILLITAFFPFHYGYAGGLNQAPSLENVSLPVPPQSVLTSHVPTTHEESLDYREISFAQIGLPRGIVFKGGQQDAGMAFGMAIDQLVLSAQMILDVKMTHAIADSDMSLQIMVNGLIVGSVPLNSVNPDKTTYQIDVPAMMVASNNVFSFKVVGDASLLCYQDGKQAEQVQILPSSLVKLQTQQLNIAANLNHFPQPFWDKNELISHPVTFVFPNAVVAEQISAAATLASWFGVQANYRGVTFNAIKGALPDSNGIVFGAPGTTIGSLILPNTSQPLLKIVDNPVNPMYKLLLIVGQTDADLRAIVWRLTQGDFAIQTTESLVGMQAIPKRVAYDAPHWIATDEPVRLQTLIHDNQAMMVPGIWHEALNFTFRAAPDLFLWDGDTIPLHIDYRFPLESWIDENHSFLNVTFNGHFLEDLPVNKQGVLENVWHRLGGDSRQEQAIIPIQPYMIYGDNQLSLYFDIRSGLDSPCATKLDTNIKSEIGDGSTIDLSHTRHFSLLPNLSFFIGASFPFSRFADFSETGLLLPKNPSAIQLQVLLGMSARSGRATGSSIVHNRVFLGMPDNTAQLEKMDLLAITTQQELAFNPLLLAHSPFVTDNNTLHVRPLTMMQMIKNKLLGHWGLTPIEADRYFSSNQAWRGFISYQSPWDKNRVIIVATATDSSELVKLDQDLQSNEVNSLISGDVSVITEGSVRSFQVSSQFPSGELPWYNMAIWYANQHSAVLAIIATLISIFLGLVLHRHLSHRAGVRLSKRF